MLCMYSKPAIRDRYAAFRGVGAMTKESVRDLVQPEPRLFTFLLVPKFPMLAFSSAIEPLRIANWLSGKTLYEWQGLTVDGEPVQASNGLMLTPNGSIRDAMPDIVFVSAGVEGCFYDDERVFVWLRSLNRKGATIGAFDTGTWLLARAGVLNGTRCTVHWEDKSFFRDSFPELEVTDDLYNVDGRRLTCSGGTATMDMVLSLVASDHGRELAGAIAEEFMHDEVRDGARNQRLNLASRMATNDSRLLAAIVLMERDIETPLTPAEISHACGASVRNLERLFKIYLDCSPTTYYRELRLKAARQLLLHGSGSVLDVALATGFATASHFARCYRASFGRSPRDDRMVLRTNGRDVH